jgi:hypothetical protein
MDADTGFLQIQQSTDNQSEFRMNMIAPAKPEIKKITDNIEMVNWCFFPSQFPGINQRPDLPFPEIIKKLHKPDISLVGRVFQVGIGYKNSFHDSLFFGLNMIVL